MKYAAPELTNLGPVAGLTRGECGWGTENWTLDKTGAQWVDTTCTSCTVNELTQSYICYTEPCSVCR